ncbi:radical SAM protein [Bradyrhizobium sp.]|uniref:B12-binding domain-containing radical SAM protein n=1 Tax=Bradyrhizobium sp. TaxID=376 RepID=UPI0026269A88|nr:radical SAM protein [Bradyrhizobium sp.]
MTASVLIKARSRSRSARIDGTRVHFSVHQCFRFDDSPEERVLVETLCAVLVSKRGLAVMAHGPLLEYMLKHAPQLKSHIKAAIPFRSAVPVAAQGLPQFPVDAIPDEIDCVFVCETLSFERMQMRRQLPPDLETVDPSILGEVARKIVPLRAWTPIERNIYPLEIPDVKLPEGKDLLLLDCPARNLALMPNGLAYVNNALKTADVSFAVFDLDIITYHRYHVRRLFDDGGRVVLPSGRVLPVDPWQAEHYDFWAMPEVIDYFMPIIVEAANEIVRAKPKVLGLSVQQCSEAFSSKLVNLVREQLPDLVVVVGGFSCYNADIGLKSFPQADYMCIGEADLTVGPLIEALARGERPRNIAGIVSQHDDPKIPFIPAPMPHNLSALEAPKYEWFDLNLYRNFNGYQLTPVIASRGCRWSRCTFCAERFYWRIRDPKEFVDELEWLAGQGCTLFMFNESDLNGMPEKVLEICDEIIRRGVNVKLTGQLRIHKKSDRAYFQKLRQAGFVALRFGVDAFSANTLRLQKKGYTPDMVSQNLRDCWEAGIFTEVNWVIGVPGETDADVDEGIELILKNRNYIGRLANINPLILVNGGVYWLDPESHNIVFREPKEALYAKHPKVVPADLWYSTGPYIDAQVRKERFEKIVLALHEAGFPVGEWAARVIEDVKYARDRNRAGGAKSSAGRSAGETKSSKPAKEEISVVGGEVPRLVRQLGTHNVVFYKGLYYALPLGLGPIDLTKEDVAGRSGVVIDPDEQAVLAEIELVAKWADSRGHFDAQEKQRAEGSYFKAGSTLGETPAAAAVLAPIIVSFEAQDYAIAKDELDRAFSDKATGAEAVADRNHLSGPARPRSLWHRAFNLLPSAVRAEIRETVMVERLLPMSSNGGKLAIAVLRSLIRRARTQGVGSLFGKNAARGNSGEVIPGTDIVVFSVASKDATPDLLRTIENYNLVQFDGRFYGVPHGVYLDWNDFDVEAIPGLVVANTAKEATYQIEEQIGGLRRRAVSEQAERGTGPAEEFFPEPILLESMGDYNVVGYEGWVYGIPIALGALDLTEVDVTEMPGVIKDVARDVVINEINFLSEQRNAVAAA